jgi:uncharacterized membrane protein
MLKYLVAYLAVGLVFAAADAVWLSSTGASLYRQTLGDILEPQFRLAPAVLFYLLYVAGILVFVMTPAFATGNWTTALLFGALYGFFCYMTYDLSSHATLRNWTAALSAIDIAWGTVLTATSSTLGFLGTQWIMSKIG